jgi:hypothetical protein
MIIEQRPIEAVRPYPNNPRNNKKAVAAVAASIKEFGFKVPIVVDTAGVIITGHTRREAAISLGMKTVPVIVADDLTEAQIRAFRLADNKVSEFSEWDEDALAEELAQLDEAALGIDMADIGFEMADAPSADDFSDDFTLPDNGRPEMCTCTFTLHYRQKELIEYVLAKLPDTEITEKFSNPNRDGSALYTVVKQWAEQRKLR